jgi:hypothetical protein
MLLAALLLASSEEALVVIACLAVGLIALLAGATSWMGFKARQLLGPVTLTLDPPSPRLGETCQATVSIRPTGAIAIDSIDLSLRGREQISWRARSGKTTVTRRKSHVFHDEACPPQRVGRITPPARASKAFRFTIPSGAPPSFSAQWNKIVWEVDIRVRVPGQRAYERTYALEVPPVMVSP